MVGLFPFIMIVFLIPSTLELVLGGSFSEFTESFGPPIPDDDSDITAKEVAPLGDGGRA
jgi:hypothetical protein